MRLSQDQKDRLEQITKEITKECIDRMKGQTPDHSRFHADIVNCIHRGSINVLHNELNGNMSKMAKYMGSYRASVRTWANRAGL